MAISAPAPSASVFERSISSFSPVSVHVTCSRSNPTSSERRRAPENASRNSARSLAPAKSPPHTPAPADPPPPPWDEFLNSRRGGRAPARGRAAVLASDPPQRLAEGRVL